MTNEEAIKLLDDITSYCDFTDEYGDMIDSTPYYEALDLAIKALEQQPCEDCISRKAVLKHLENITMDTNPDHYGSKDKWYQANGFNMCKVGIEMYVKNLPSVTPKTEWISVSERLPEAFGGDYLVTIEHKGEVEGVDQATYGTFGYIDGLWDTVNDWIEGYSEDWHVTAWMPLPQPYKAESEDKE